MNYEYNTKRLVNFTGQDDEDFEYFHETMTDYFDVKKIITDKQKLATMKTLLAGKAKADFEEINPRNPDTELFTVSYHETIKLLKEKHEEDSINPQSKWLQFMEITQGPDESPKAFEAKLIEAARRAGIKDKNQLEIRFMTGLHQEIRDHCRASGARTFEDYRRMAQGF
ncbi:hypothetical protein BD770DRAFT_328010, partial [Pilaira anomala]